MVEEVKSDLIRLSDLKFEDVRFFLDLEIFVYSLESVYRVLQVCPPGPSAELDFYQLYCQHVQGDRHIIRVLQGICEISEKYNTIADNVSKSKVQASKFGRKTDAKLIKFCLDQDIEFALNDPFILPEVDFRQILYKIWKSEGRVGQLTRNRKCEIYKLYCLHILEHRQFFQGIYGLSIIIPNGPFDLSQLEQMLVMFKSVPDASFMTGPDACSLAYYVREGFGIDHEFFKKLPRVLRLIASNAQVQISCPKMSRLKPFGSTHEYLQLASVAPSACKDFFRVQLSFPTDLLSNDDIIDAFTWVFLSTEDPGTFLIRNDRRKEFLTVEEPEDSGLCPLSTTLNHNDPRARFNLRIEGQFLRIISTCNATPIIVDTRSQQVYVPNKNHRFTEAAIFLLKTV